MYSIIRLRRLRKNFRIRNMIAETFISKESIVQPYFVVCGKKIKKEISSMPGNYHFSSDVLVEEVKRVVDMGLKNILLFGIPDKKDNLGTSAYSKNNVVANAVERIKKNNIDVTIIADVCLCEYTSHGHCGIVKNGKILNDETLPLLAKAALSYANAGADIIAPSDMMDGRVKYIREYLDNEGFKDILIMSYSAKYASSFYGPFREAAQSRPSFGDRATYQMDIRQKREAIREVEQDILEGADIIMVKPALVYLDVISKVRESFNVPLACYSVSGEYSMVKAANKMGWLDEKKAALEILTAIKRAGADIIITYWAKDLLEWKVL